MLRAILITDYKGNFGSKYDDYPYRSGFDKSILRSCFEKRNIEATFLAPSEFDLSSGSLSDSFVLFTSQEDEGLHYKAFLEDFLYALCLKGIRIIPGFHLFKAHEDKVFFEMLRKISNHDFLTNLKSQWFGTYEEFAIIAGDLDYPVVIKTHNGSMSRGVHLARTRKEALYVTANLSKTPSLKKELRDYLRCLRHKGYKRESWNRKRFIIQEYLPGLKMDFKILVFGNKYFALKRETSKNDFRASGQGKFSFDRNLPEGLLSFAKNCYSYFRAPHASFDIAFDGKEFYLLEAQFLYFGTYTIEFSTFYFQFIDNNWICVEGRSILEEEYVNSVADFIENESSVCI